MLETNKYAEGKPYKRFYNGCENIDKIEELAQKRAEKLFGMDHANVQPHSGAQANMAVFMAVLKQGDKVLGMVLSNGGHLSHGSPVNFSGLYCLRVPDVFYMFFIFHNIRTDLLGYLLYFLHSGSLHHNLFQDLCP